MTAINIKAFRGKVPRTSPRLLNGNYAVEALNVKITGGRIDPIRGPVLVHTSQASSIRTMFRYRHLGTDYWLVWGKQVDVARSPTAQDAKNRLFWTGDGEPRMGAFADVIQGSGAYPGGWYVLGVYPPVAAFTVTPSLTGTQEERAYVFTFRTQYDEESGPSPAIIAKGDQAQAWNLAGMELPPTNAGTISAVNNQGGGIIRLTVDTTRGLSVHEEMVLAGDQWLTTAFFGGVQKIVNIASATEFDIQHSYTGVVPAGLLAGTGTWARRAPHNTLNMTRRIYRTVGNNKDFKLVAEIPATQTTYADTKAATLLGAAIQTLTSFPPPKNGHSHVALANGAHAMLAGNQLCLSEQYKPYSYPLENRYAFDGVGVALIAQGNSVIVLRDGKPRVYVCSVPEAASGADLPTYAPCISKAGAVDAGAFGLYPSHDGLYAVTPNDARNVTEKLYGLDEWRELVPESFVGEFHDNTYFAVHTHGTRQRVLQVDMADPDSVRELDTGADALFANPLDGRLYMATGNKVLEYNADDSNRYLAYWRSGDFQMGSPLNFNCAQVHAEYADIVSPDMTVLLANQAIFAGGPLKLEGAYGWPTAMYPFAGSNVREVAPVAAKRVQFSLVKDGDIVFTKELDSSAPFRLPVKERAELYAVLIASSLPVYSVTVAQSMRELGRTSG
jgi:hypothetical protein